MSTAVIEPGPREVAPAYVLSGWWRRVGAAVVDCIVIGVGALVLLVAITAPFSVGFFASDSAGTTSLVIGLLVAIACVSVAALLYAPAMMTRTDGRTLGRMATGIRVVRASGEPMNFGTAVIREVVLKAFAFPLVGSITGGILSLLDVLWPLWDGEKRALHDIVVDTRVVRDA
jgi:uncharacterized RDD family membrane protein YckC